MGSELGLTADMAHEARLDAVGIFWVVLASAWTVMVLAGMGFLYVRRHMPILRMRGLLLSFSAVTCLHLYWISVQLGYVFGPIAPGDHEYWIMGTWLPFGIALFHASNSRFLHVAQGQKRFVQQEKCLKVPEPKRSPIARFQQLDHTVKMLALIGGGMIFQVRNTITTSPRLILISVQLFTTVLMYLISRKWHSSWGIPGTEIYGSEMEQKIQMGRGWEWWPSVVWQFFWAWLVAPMILWKARKIHDTQGWRLQTIACCMVNLHATPMWLIALYVPAMEKVNEYFIPPQWIAVSIMMMEMFTVFLPCWEVLRHQNLQQETLDSIAQWESKKRAMGPGVRSLNSGSTVMDSLMTGWKSTDGSIKSTSDESILSMGALEHVLERNPEPLLQFSALRDFSGENIAFLTSVAEWKASISSTSRKLKRRSLTFDNEQHMRHHFSTALSIYTTYISSRDADFPINISSQTLKKLEAIFEACARSVYGDKSEVDLATPFDAAACRKDSGSDQSDSEKRMMESQAPVSVFDDGSEFQGRIPDAFDEHIFDEAEKSIKYLVLTNTWPKFVKERRSSLDSCVALEAGQAVVQALKDRRRSSAQVTL
ncbi:hypothetical protein HJFPF1_10122 [Paramyrothecium foliicola]|nr:hypothetical protein HJFPF1_10122 [Paramyrothecium foliicola]